MAGLALVSVAGCKVARWKKPDKEASNAGAVATPARVGEADASASTAQRFDVDEKSGRPRGSLVLRLDYFPEPKPGSTNLPACYAPFAADFDLGIAYCDGKPEAKVPVTAKNVDQDCYTDPKLGRRPAAQPVILAGCRKGILLVHAFQPALRVDVEVRDLN